MINVDAQQIIERSIYTEILNVALELGLTLDPDKYNPPTPATEKQFEEDMEQIKADTGTFIYVFGVSNNESRDQKFTPRITIESEGFYPGGIGLPRTMIEKNGAGGYTKTEGPYEAIDQYIDIHVVTNNQQEMRLLHNIVFTAIPQRGYIKPWPSKVFLFDGNIYLELFNFYNKPNDKGILEKVYQFAVYDTLLETGIPPQEDIPAISDISILLHKSNNREDQEIIHVTKTP